MGGIKDYSLRSVNLLNLLLAVTIGILTPYTIFPLLEVGVQYTIPAPKGTAFTLGEDSAEAPMPSVLDYAVVSEKNLFHPERKIPVEKKDEQVLSRPEIILYGTLITPEVSLAYIEDKKSPQTSEGRGKRQTVLKKGESVGGFILKEIGQDRIVLMRGEERMDVYLYDVQQKKQRETPESDQRRGAQPPAPRSMPGAKSGPGM